MTASDLLSKPEFWSALFGALAAFLLGALATWWSNLSAKRTAGNMAIIALSQMYSLMENIRYQLLVAEPLRIQKILKRPPLSFEIRPAIGLPESLPRVPADGLGFLADSHDPDIFNRLLTIERAFASMFDLLRRHEVVHAKITEKMSAFDPAGQKPFGAQVILEVVGTKLLVEVDTIVEGLEKGLPETRDMLLAVGQQLRGVLRIQIPHRRFVGFTSAPRSRISSQPPDLPKPALWRRTTRWTFDLLAKRRSLPQCEPSDSSQAAALEEESKPPHIARFPPRSWENQQPPADRSRGPS
jgi:hypothetical protein